MLLRTSIRILIVGTRFHPCHASLTVCSKHLSLATVVQPSKDTKDMSEQQELDHFQEGNRWLEEAQQDVAWIHRLQNEAQTVEERRVSHLIP